MSRQKRFIRRAHIASKEGNCKFLIGAVVVLGNKIISTGCCTRKTHPQNPKLKSLTKKCQLCAEVNSVLRASKKLSKQELKRCRLYVARTRKDQSMGAAKPCSYCLSFLKEVGIKEIYYTTSSGSIKYMEA